MRLTLEVFVEGECAVERLANVGRVLDVQRDDEHDGLQAGRIEEVELVNGRLEVEAQVPDLALVRALVDRWDEMYPAETRCFTTDELRAVEAHLGRVRRAVKREIHVRAVSAAHRQGVLG